MPKNKCCVPFCRSGYDSTRKKNNQLGIRNPSIFKFPSMYTNHNNVFSTDESLEGQIKEEICSENDAPTPKFACTKCNRAFTTNQNLKRHIGSQVCSRPAKPTPDFACSNCYRVFATNQNLKDHLEKQICSKNKSALQMFTCPHYENPFATNQSLKRHLQEQVCFRQSKSTAVDFACSNYDYTFSTYCNLKEPTEKQKWLKNIRSSISDFTCSNCNRTFASNQSLQRHVDNEICSKPLEKRGLSRKVFRCSNCSGSFGTSRGLLRHTDSQICLGGIKPDTSAINPELFEIWEKAIRRADRRLSAKDKICQLHFQKEFIKTHDQVLLSNGDVFVSKRRKLQLLRGAIPTIFPDEPSGNSRAKIKNRRPSADKQPLQNIKASVKKRRLETICSDSLTDASRNAVPEKQHTASRNSTINFILHDGHTDASQDTLPNLQPNVNDNCTMDFLDDGRTDALEESALESRHTNDVQLQLPALESNPLADLSDDCITIDDRMLEVQHTGKHNPVTVWIKEEEDDCVHEFADSTDIENFDDLFHKCSKIEFPDNRWGYTMVANNILISYWSPSFDCLKKIIIDEDLKISAFVKDVGIIIGESSEQTEAHDLNTVKNVVKKLHEIKECAYNPAKSIRWKCRGFVKQNKTYCSSCSFELEKVRIFKKKAD